MNCVMNNHFSIQCICGLEFIPTGLTMSLIRPLICPRRRNTISQSTPGLCPNLPSLPPDTPPTGQYTSTRNPSSSLHAANGAGFARYRRGHRVLLQGTFPIRPPTALGLAAGLLRMGRTRWGRRFRTKTTESVTAAPSLGHN